MHAPANLENEVQKEVATDELGPLSTEPAL